MNCPVWMVLFLHITIQLFLIPSKVKSWHSTYTKTFSFLPVFIINALGTRNNFGSMLHVDHFLILIIYGNKLRF